MLQSGQAALPVWEQTTPTPESTPTKKQIALDHHIAVGLQQQDEQGDAVTWCPPTLIDPRLAPSPSAAFHRVRRVLIYCRRWGLPVRVPEPTPLLSPTHLTITMCTDPQMRMLFRAPKFSLLSPQ